MFGWVDRLAAAIYQRGRGLTEVNDRIGEERRAAIRAVRDALRDAMAHAEQEREHGEDEQHDAAMVAARLASATVQEVADQYARKLVADWRAQFDAIQKGYKRGPIKNMYTGERDAPGYPEPAWSELRAAEDAAQDRLGTLLRELLDSK